MAEYRIVRCEFFRGHYAVETKCKFLWWDYWYEPQVNTHESIEAAEEWARNHAVKAVERARADEAEQAAPKVIKYLGRLP